MDLWQCLMNIIMDESFEFLPAVFLKFQLCCYEMVCRGMNSHGSLEGTSFRNVDNCCTERHSVTPQKSSCSWRRGFSFHKRLLVCWVSELISVRMDSTETILWYLNSWRVKCYSTFSSATDKYVKGILLGYVSDVSISYYYSK